MTATKGRIAPGRSRSFAKSGLAQANPAIERPDVVTLLTLWGQLAAGLLVIRIAAHGSSCGGIESFCAHERAAAMLGHPRARHYGTHGMAASPDDVEHSRPGGLRS